MYRLLLYLHMPLKRKPSTPREKTTTFFMTHLTRCGQTQAAYSALITSVDKLDGIASRGMREKGGLKDDTELLEVYGKCVERGSALLDLLPKSG